MSVLDIEELIKDRVDAIAAFHEKVGEARAELDVSGGVDSAVMLGLLSKAVGPKNITAVYSSINSSNDSHERAKEVAETFGAKLIFINYTVFFEDTIQMMLNSLLMAGYDPDPIVKRMEEDPTILGSIRSCIRAPLGRGFNRLTGGGIRHGTGNECEDRWLRFYQKGGDGEVDTNPLAMLSKGEVYELAIGLGVPSGIIAAAPSPDLHGTGEDGHSDEEELLQLHGVPWTYSRLEQNPESGEWRYSYVGTIERASRFLDSYEKFFARCGGDIGRLDLRFARRFFPEDLFADDEVVAFLESLWKVERATKHKYNPNIPTLGRRKELRIRKIITNDLPEGLPAF